MTNNEIICDTELISRYIDNELDSEELVSLKAHITSCESCSTRIHDYGKIGAGMNALLQSNPGQTAGELENRIVESIRRKKNTGFKGWKDIIFSKRMMVPVGLAASVTIMFFTIFNNPSPIGPTAIVSSLSGSGSSVMILETSETRQTILWFSENG